MKNKALTQDVIISYIAIFIALITTIFLTKIEVKYLGTDIYGLFSLVNSTIGYIAILDLGVGQTVTRYIAQYRAEGNYNKIRVLVGNSFKNYIKISLIGLIIGIIIIIKSQTIFSSLTDDTVGVFKICFVISLLNITLQIPAATFNSILSAFKEFKIMKIMSIIKVLIRAIVITVLLVNGFGIVSIFVLDFILNQCINISYYMIVKFKLDIKMDFTPMDKSIKREISNYSFYIFLGIITDQIFWKTDGIILGIMSTTTIVAIYAISGQLISQYLNICSTFSSVFLPRIVDKIAAGESMQQINKFFIKASRYQFMFVGMILVSYIFVGKDFIILWLGAEFVNAYYYGLIIIVSLTVPMFQTTGYQILYAMKKHKVRSIIYLCNSILNLVASIIFYKLIGTVGVAIATALTMFLGNTIIMNIYYKKALSLKLMHFFKEVCMKTSLAMILTSITYIILNKFIGIGIIGFLVKATIANIIYITIIFFVSFNDYERREVMRIIFRKKYINYFRA